MYDMLSELFVLLFATFYLILFAALIFRILKPWLVRVLRKDIGPVSHRVFEPDRIFRRESYDASDEEGTGIESTSGGNRQSASEGHRSRHHNAANIFDRSSFAGARAVTESLEDAVIPRIYEREV